MALGALRTPHEHYINTTRHINTTQTLHEFHMNSTPHTNSTWTPHVTWTPHKLYMNSTWTLPIRWTWWYWAARSWMLRRIWSANTLELFRTEMWLHPHITATHIQAGPSKDCWRLAAGLLKSCKHFAENMLQDCWHLANILLKIAIKNDFWKHAGTYPSRSGNLRNMYPSCECNPCWIFLHNFRVLSLLIVFSPFADKVSTFNSLKSLNPSQLKSWTGNALLGPINW